MREQIYDAGGIRLGAALNPNLKSFCLALYVRAGSLFENSSDNGISHMFEHMVFRNLKRKYDNFYEQLALHGIELQGCTYKEFIRFTLIGPVGEFSFASDILCSIFDDISLPKTEFDNEKRRIKAEIREKDERSSLDYYFNNLVWLNSEAEKNVLGYCKVLDGISLKRINGFRREFLSEGNVLIYVTGNASANDILSLKEKLSSLDIGQGTYEKTNTVSADESFFNRSLNVNVKNGYWNCIRIGFDIDCTKYPVGVYELLYSVLFKGEKALIHNYLSEETPLIYSYDSTLEMYDNIGNISFKFEVGRDKTEEAISVVVRLLNDIREGLFNFEASLKSELYYTETETDRPDDHNWSMAYYNHILNTMPIDHSDEFFGRFRVTKEQVINSAKEIFRVRNMTVAIKGDKKKINVKNIEEILTVLG